ncbi:lipocalin-like domain-containing protein [Reinekea blandensis]|uniref:AttH domain-containing protein n=1 Tax=Reinekea blandensis MED297 TaxID=314283 RepID=A4BCD6_9GAMM|nr:lipocalin-like domain-containing protein [Reinekea blandensis]EAR10202.1 hypothetical protein MED297_13302 [Reinekea sp. MED297] [Reinekea blandensis MED297]
MKTAIALFIGLLCTTAVADNEFNLLRSDASGFTQVSPGLELSFPADHLPHPDYRIEWWYLTANLTDEDGQHWGIHWTLFRQSLRPEPDPGGWQSTQAWMAHAALSTPENHVYDERFARGGISQAGVELTAEGRFDAWLDDWQWLGTGTEPLPGTLVFTVSETRVELDLSSQTPWVLQGDNGYSQKAPSGQASAYYSQPHIDIAGQIQHNGNTFQVTGSGWLDREWSSQPLAPSQPGWDWFSLHLSSGDALMVYQLRDTQAPNTLNGIWVTPDGRFSSLSGDQITLSSKGETDVSTRAGTRKMPLRWSIEVPAHKVDIEVSAPRADHWLDTLFPYWEGPVSVTGSHQGKGYMELTGY